MVITQAIASTILNLFTSKIIDKLDENESKIKKVLVTQSPDGFSSTELDYAETENQKWSQKDKPDLEFENILEKESIVKEISIIPDDSFKTLGKVIVTIDDSIVFKNRAFDSFRDVTESKIKINTTITQDSKVKFFIISKDGSKVRLTAQVTFSE